ncbi:MAG TPA: threonine--tRNA ligase [Candidatus Saccharimonadales bacterium]|nr:threonine--tRNA ligase [Candidatus Saccharimonadales bacterium]
MADNQQSDLHAMRHSLAHIMATAITHIWPEVKLGVGPVVENGFYYDIDLGEHPLSEEDFSRIETEMQKIIKEDQPFERFTKPIDEAITWAKDARQSYKEELLNDLKRAGTTVAKELNSEELGVAAEGEGQVSEVSFYKNGDFTDLCRGPHVASTGKVGAFKLMRISGAYWRGKDTNPQMQRVYGVGFTSEAELKQHLEMLEEAKKRDHRKLGQELDLFVFSDLVGPGLPLFTPRGTVLRDELNAFSQELQEQGGYERVTIPHITRIDLYKTSGHYDKYPERFTVKSEESDDDFMMKPMNCPHHTQIYASRPRSYRDLPIRYMETTMVYRDEKAGELHGLSRVRAATQDDSHAFVRIDQVEAEFESISNMVKTMYEDIFQMPFRVRLAFRDESDKYFGDKALWERAQDSIKKIADKIGFEYVIEEGEATFYGPKIEFVVKDALGRENQCATIQLDFVMPERFGLEYTAEDGSKQRPVMAHKALLGSIERFLSVYIEHTAGRFPVWLAPEQLRIVTLNQDQDIVDFAYTIQDQAHKLGVRATVDDGNESVGKKIRNAELMKIPYVAVIGPKEVETSELTPRIRKDMEVDVQHPPRTPYELVKTLANEAKMRVTKTSL